jgi:anti-sigma28 factor (negative regulator of flagellin synthesis)
MQIERTDGLSGPNRPGEADGFHKPASYATHVGKPVESVPAISGSELQELAKQAAAASEINWDKVAEARKLIESGSLATPEAVQNAARRLVDFGV